MAYDDVEGDGMMMLELFIDAPQVLSEVSIEDENGNLQRVALRPPLHLEAGPGWLLLAPRTFIPLWHVSGRGEKTPIEYDLD